MPRSSRVSGVLGKYLRPYPNRNFNLTHGLLKYTDVQLPFIGKNSIGHTILFFVSQRVLKLLTYFFLQKFTNFILIMDVLVRFLTC